MFYIGEVESVIDSTESGEFIAKFPKLDNNKPQRVTYTSPFCKANAGGFIAVPEVGDQIIALYNENPTSKERPLYYHSTVIKTDLVTGNPTVRKDFKPLRSNDTKAQIYGEEEKPVTQTFTNTFGAGLYIQRDYSDTKISNNVTLKAESGDEVNVGSLGIQLTTSEGDHICLTGAESNDTHSGRTLSIETRSLQEYKCLNSDIRHRIVDGGDYLIENNSTGLFSISGKWWGNIRLKSRYRNIDLAALAPTSNVNIITQGARIQVDGTGAVKIETIGSIDFNAAQDINMTAGGSVNIVGNLGAQIGSQTGAAQVNAPTVFVNNQALAFNAGPPGVGVPSDSGAACTSTPIEGQAAIPAVPPVIVPNDYNDPIGAA